MIRRRKRVMAQRLIEAGLRERLELLERLERLEQVSGHVPTASPAN
jgi:hypothetical protein